MYSRVYVEITNFCNMHCSFCHGHNRISGKMTSEQFTHILNQLDGKTAYLYYHLMGEPLTYPELPVFLEMAANRGFRSVITTNGTLLNERGQWLIHAKVHKVNISLHSFEGTDENAHRRYVQQVAEFADAAASAGILISLRLWNNGCDDGRNTTVLSCLRQFFDCQWTENTRGYRIRKNLYLEWGDRFSWPDKEAAHISDQVYCYGLKDHFGILCDGTVVPCCLDSDGVIALGNVFTQDLEQILSSPRAQAMKRGFSCRKATEELCRRCGYAQRF